MLLHFNLNLEGNGHENDFIGRDDIFIIDFYNPGIYPKDVNAKRGISKTVHVTYTDNDNEYLEKMNS